MNHPPEGSLDHPAPRWLADRLRAAGGQVPFRTYMEWVLHDPLHGAYGSGALRMGPQGDFVTSPSLGADFAVLLAPQIAEWLKAFGESRDPPVLIEAGPGEGHLALQLAEALAAGWPDLATRTQMVLVEPNPGLADRQRRHLRDSPLAVRWSSFPELAEAPVRGVVLAHEVLDALAVDRIEWDGTLWRRQDVALRNGALALAPGAPLASGDHTLLDSLGLRAEDPRRFPGWCTELHPGLEPWLRGCAGALRAGWLLVIDYALEARRYYAPTRAGGTLLAYRAQRTSSDPLVEPGRWDLTAHLCLESLREAAGATHWRWLGERRQGEALLALGLAGRLHGLQQGPPEALATLLARREALLRLVDPAGLGEFRWIAFARGRTGELPEGGGLPRFLRDPPPEPPGEVQ